MDQPSLPNNYPPVLPQSTMALVSLIAGIAGFTFLPMIGGIVALITGYAARKETRAMPPIASGDGMATAGIIMGWIQVGLTAVGVCCVAAWFLFIGGAAIWGSGQ